MFGAAAMFRPEQTQVIFEVFRSQSTISCSGRVLQDTPKFQGEIRGILAKSRSTENVRWKQLSHPVSHVIIVRGIPSIPVMVGDILRWQGRDFLVNAVPYDIGGIGHWTELYCDERRDLQ